MLVDIRHAFHPELDVLDAELQGTAEEKDSVEHNNEKYLASHEVKYHAWRATERCDPALSCALEFDFGSEVCSPLLLGGRLLAYTPVLRRPARTRRFAIWRFFYAFPWHTKSDNNGHKSGSWMRFEKSYGQTMKKEYTYACAKPWLLDRPGARDYTSPNKGSRNAR